MIHTMHTISMSAKELDRYAIIQRLVNKEINGTDAARFLKLSVRQVQRLKRRVKEQGALGLIHRLRGKSSNHRMPILERARIVRIVKQRYPDFKPTFASEKLARVHHIRKHPTTIRQIMITEGLWKPHTQRSHDQHRSWRPRRQAFGEMEQFDGSYENWFEARGARSCLLAAIDDATGKITQAVFADHEGVFPVLAFWKQYVEIHGKPRSIYLDKFSTYKMNAAVAEDNHDLLTQFERVCRDLGIELIHANSPQAKGRVERLFLTLQDRLIKELRLAGISTILEANQFLKEVFIPQFNTRFHVQPASAADLHIPLTKDQEKRLPSTFSRQSSRVVHNDFTISFKNQWYQLIKNQPITVCKRDEVSIEEWLDHTIHIRLRGKELAVFPIPKRSREAGIKTWVLPATAAGLSRTVAAMAAELSAESSPKPKRYDISKTLKL